MKTLGMWLFGIAITVLPICGQEAQLSVKRHPNDHLHYTVTVLDGDIDKITIVVVHLSSPVSAASDQPGAVSQFGANCQKSADPKMWDCDIVIPTNVANGNYRLSEVAVSTPDFGKAYDEDFHVPIVPIENLKTFNPPSKVKVTERP
jgi:hypothetical protein